jgi:hypothetical protein
MKKQNHIHKIVLAVLLVMVGQVVFAFTSTSSGHSTEKNAAKKYSLYSLSNIGKFNTKALSLNSAKYTFHLKPTELNGSLSTKGSLVTGNNVEFTKGNSTFIYPYKVKVKVPKFKAPSPTAN